jgi:hypothetical protein
MAPRAEADLVQQRVGAAPRIGRAGDLERHAHVLPRRERRQQVEELEDEADAGAAKARQRVLDIAVMSEPSIRIRPVDGASSPASSPSSVDLPLPDGP